MSAGNLMFNESKNLQQPFVNLSNPIGNSAYYRIQEHVERTLQANFQYEYNLFFIFIREWICRNARNNKGNEDGFIALFPNNFVFFKEREPTYLFPMPWGKELTIGDLLINTAHTLGFTVRFSLYKSYNEKESPTPKMIQFLPIPKLLINFSLPAAFNTLKFALEPYSKEKNQRFQTFDDSQPRGYSLNTVLKMLEERYRNEEYKIEMKTHPKLEAQFVHMDLKGDSTLFDILKIIALHLDAVWDWVDARKLYITADWVDDIPVI